MKIIYLNVDVFKCSEVTPVNLQMVLHRLDPAKSLDEVQLIISKTFSISLEKVSSLLEREEQHGLTTPTSKVLRKLRKIGTTHSGPKV